MTAQRIFFILLPLCAATLVIYFAFALSGAPAVDLTLPDNNKVFNTTNSINFSCNATDDESLRKLELYTNINGSFARTNTSCFGELCEDSSTMLLMHFNNDSLAGENDTLVYDWSGNGNNATVYGVVFNPSGGNFSGAFEFGGNDNEYIKISDSSSLDITQNGTIEFWIYPMDISIDAYILTKAPGESCIDSAYAVILTQGSIELDFGSNAGDYTYTGAAVSQDQWSHVAATWNGSGVTIYVNNVSGGEIESDGRTDIGHTAPNIINNDNPVWIATTETACVLPMTAYYNSPNYFTGRIDELAIYNRALSAEEIDEHYGRRIAVNATKNFTSQNVPDGTYTWNCRAYDNESQSGWGAANRTFYVDMTSAPEAHSIIISPNSTDDVDPNVLINVTANITDASGVSAAILQYIWPSGSVTNVTMGYNGATKLYNATFTPTVNGIWKYRIWSNDTVGNAAIRNETNLSVEYDYTWRLSVINISGENASDFGTISALNGTTAFIGTVIINNTGDNTLNFDLSYSPTSPDIQMAYNISEPIDVGAKNATAFNITATSPQQIYEWPIQLIINTSALATPAGAIVSGTLVPFRGGPYLDVSIRNYEATVSHGQSFNISARAKNLGNETATNVWLNWTLPTGWSVTSGNQSENFASIPNGSTRWNNITVLVSTTAATLGTFDGGIDATATSDEGITGTDTKTVSVVCSNSDGVCGNGCTYAADNDCAQASSGTSASSGGGAASSSSGGGGGVAKSQKYSLSVSAPERVDAYRGKDSSFTITVSGAGMDTSVNDITLSISGYSHVLVSMSPSIIKTLGRGETKKFEAKMEVPNYMQYGEYDLELIAKGIGTSTTKSANASYVQAEKTIKFVVHSISENETVMAIDDATSQIALMSGQGIATAKTARLLEDAEKALGNWNYDAAKGLAENVIELSSIAFRSHEMLNQVSGMIDEANKYGVSAAETSRMYALAKAAFEREDYARAEERAKNALLTGSIETTGKVMMIKSAKENSPKIAVALLVAILLFSISYRRAAKKSLQTKISRLDEEEKSLRKLITDTKKDYFERNAIGKSEYYRTIYEQEKQVASVSEARAKTMMSLIALKSAKGAAKEFKKEEAKIIKRIEEEQRKYFERGAVSKDSYQNTVKELKSELAEIKMNVEETKGTLKNGKAALIVAIICATAFFIPGVWAQDMEKKASAENAIEVAEKDLLDMQAAGLGIVQANDTLNEAKLLLSQGSYDAAQSLANYVDVLKKTAMEINALIDDAETEIYDAKAEGADATGAESQFAAGIDAFGKEDYVSAEKLLNSAITSAEEARAKNTMQKALEGSGDLGVWGFLKKQKQNIAVLLIVCAASVIIIRKAGEIRRKKKRCAQLKNDIAAANKMIKELQKKYYEGFSIGKTDYESGMKKCRERIMDAKRELAGLEKAAKTKTVGGKDAGSAPEKARNIKLRHQ